MKSPAVSCKLLEKQTCLASGTALDRRTVPESYMAPMPRAQHLPRFLHWNTSTRNKLQRLNIVSPQRNLIVMIYHNLLLGNLEQRNLF